MARSIRSLGLVGAALAFLLIAGLNFTALKSQWDVPYMGLKKAHASGFCALGYCMVVTPSGSGSNKWGCWPVYHNDPNSCGPGCSSC